MGVGRADILHPSVVSPALVGRYAEKIVGDQPLVGHDIVAVLLRVVGDLIVVEFGVALHGVEELPFHIPHKAHMGQRPGEEQIAGLGGVLGAGEGFHFEIIRSCPGGFFDNILGDLRLPGAPGHKVGAPGLTGIAAPIAKFGIVADQLGVAHLTQRDIQNILALVAGVFVCIAILHTCRIGSLYL